MIAHPLPSPFAVIPFILLLTLVAVGPLFFPHFWHRHYAWIAPAFGVSVLVYYGVIVGDKVACVETVVEYLQFIIFIGALFIVSGSVLIRFKMKATPLVNLGVLLSGSTIANLIGTTGASMLLIRPFMALNKGRLQPFHVIFFIFMVSNVGGVLLPIGDMPLFIGFLRGVPFFWTLVHCFLPWVVVIASLGGVFFFMDSKIPLVESATQDGKGSIEVKGKGQLLFFGVIIGAIFCDPSRIGWLPKVVWHGHTFSFVREVILLSVMGVSYRFADKEAMAENKFSFEPLKEVLFIFMGIFGTMLPALVIIRNLAMHYRSWLTPSLFYWSTGPLSAFLDNAPAFLASLTAGMGTVDMDVNNPLDVALYATSVGVKSLRAIALASVFFGAMTYIGNGPNFMVKAIAEEKGVEMPSFGGYVWYYSLPFLAPVLLLEWLLFIYLG